MTTNSPNPVDGDLQALIDHINTQLDLLRSVTIKHVDEFQIEDIKMDIKVHEVALASLTAEPVAATEKHEISNMQATGLYLRAWPTDRQLNEKEGYTIKLYTTPPAQLLRPVELPKNKEYPDDCSEVMAHYEAEHWNAAIRVCAELLRQQGYEVKS